LSIFTGSTTTTVWKSTIGIVENRDDNNRVSPISKAGKAKDEADEA
jgi:hypothetical protein